MPVRWIAPRLEHSDFGSRLQSIYDDPTTVKVNLGAGKTRLPRSLSVDLAEEDCLTLDIRDLSVFPAAFFDVAVAHQVLEHIPFRDVQETLSGWARVVRGDGLLVVSVPWLDGIMKIYRDAGQLGIHALNFMLYCEPKRAHMGHQCVFNEGLMRDMLGVAGFEIEELCFDYPPGFTPCLTAIAKRREPDVDCEEDSFSQRE